MKLLYFHVPKTAGSSINQFFATHIPKYHFHIESQKELDKTFCEKYDFLSGHVTFKKMDTLLDLKEWITVATFREPLSYTISHLKWVRKLADEGEEKNLKAHTEIIQKIALKMKEFDFSKPSEITAFIQWLEAINVLYFHNTQTFYMHPVPNASSMTDKQMDIAIKNMRSINFIGIQESLGDFMEMISYEFGWELEDKPRVNVNDNNYGFDINDPETQKALLPLYEKDLILYEEAKKLYQTQKALYSKTPTKNIIGHVDSITHTEVVGWARSQESLQKVELELKVDGITIQGTTARIFRQGLKTKGIHPSGLCEFRFILTDKINYDNCKVHIVGTNIELPLPTKKKTHTLNHEITPLSKVTNQVFKKKKSCILHIGLHKTGSSSIQANLFKSLDDPNYLYINLGSANHSIPIYSLFSENPEQYYVHKRHRLNQEEVSKYNEAVIEKFITSFQSSSAQNVIISGEDISVLSSVSVKKLKVFLDQFFDKIKVVVYIREPHAYIVSSFQQLVNGGRKKDFNITIGCYPQYRSKIEKFDNIFGIKNVDVLYFDKNSLYKQDVVLDFCHHLGINFDETKLINSNESISKEALALLYVYYKFGPGFGTGKNVIKTNALLRNKLNSIGKTKISFTKELTEHIIQKHNDDIEWIQNRMDMHLDKTIQSSSNDITKEEDLFTVAISLLPELKQFMQHKKLPEGLGDKAPLKQVVELIHLLKIQINTEEKKIQ